MMQSARASIEARRWEGEGGFDPRGHYNQLEALCSRTTYGQKDIDRLRSSRH